MKNVLILNAHQYHPMSEGYLSRALVERLADYFNRNHYPVHLYHVDDGYNIAEQVEEWLWADYVIVQCPVYWMGVPWGFKRYLDEVLMEGVTGLFCEGDGRSESDPKHGYGTGGTLKEKRYMLSLTLNAPAEAFNDRDEWFFAGKSIDDLFLPLHLSFKFLAMEPLPTFSCFDVKKNPQLDQDFHRLEQHLQQHFPNLMPLEKS